MRVRTFGLAVLLLAPLGGVAAEPEPNLQRGELQRQGRAWVEEATCGVPVQEGGRLVVRTDFGSVRVKPGAADRMECRVRLSVFTPNEEDARRLLSRYELSLRRVTGGGAYLAGELRDAPRRGMRFGAEFDITVPLRFHLDLETQGGDLAVEALEGELRAATAGGDIHTGDIGGPVRTETAGGNITLGNIGQGAVATTAGGCITVGDVRGDATLETSGGVITAGQIEGRVRAETAGGDIVLAGARSDIVAETAGGQIRIGESGAGVRATTAGGSIHLGAARGPVRVETAGGSLLLFRLQGAVDAETVAGRILAAIAASRETFGPSRLETAFGDVEVYLPPDLPLTIDAAIEMAAGHKILTDFPLEIQGGQASYVPTTLRGHGALNGGGEILRIRTQGGDIIIRKLDRVSLEQLQKHQKPVWKYREKHSPRPEFEGNSKPKPRSERD